MTRECLKKTNNKAISFLERIINGTIDKLVKNIKDAFAVSVKLDTDDKRVDLEGQQCV